MASKKKATTPKPPVLSEVPTFEEIRGKDKGGRPLRQINAWQVLECAKLGLITSEIAAVLRCSNDLLQRRFAKEMAEGLEHRNSRLRRKQFELALAGNATMLIWLGKQNLGQKDRNEFTGPNNEPLFKEPSSRQECEQRIAAILAKAKKKTA